MYRESHWRNNTIVSFPNSSSSDICKDAQWLEAGSVANQTIERMWVDIGSDLVLDCEQPRQYGHIDLDSGYVSEGSVPDLETMSISDEERLD